MLQKTKLQLFHRLQRRHRDAWKHYWGSFQLFLEAKISLEEFHALAEKLLGPDKHVHNKFVVLLLLSTSYQEMENGELSTSLQPPPGLETMDYNGKEGGEELLANDGPSMTCSKDPLLQIIKKEGTKHDSEQRQHEVLGCKRPHSSLVSADNNAEETAANKLMHLDSDKSHDDAHPDHQSAQLLMGLGRLATTVSPSSRAVSMPINSSRDFEL